VIFESIKRKCHDTHVSQIPIVSLSFQSDKSLLMFHKDYNEMSELISK